MSAERQSPSQLRRFLPAVLPGLSDRRQAARRPPDEQAAALSGPNPATAGSGRGKEALAVAQMSDHGDPAQASAIRQRTEAAAGSRRRWRSTAPRRRAITIRTVMARRSWPALEFCRRRQDMAPAPERGGHRCALGGGLVGGCSSSARRGRRIGSSRVRRSLGDQTWRIIPELWRPGRVKFRGPGCRCPPPAVTARGAWTRRPAPQQRAAAPLSRVRALLSANARTPTSRPQTADELTPTMRPSISGSIRLHGVHCMRTAYPTGYGT